MSGLRALVVEDDATVARMLRDVLEGEGFTVQVEPDGESGLRAFVEQGAELVLVDMLLPRFRGPEVIAKIRAVPNGEHIPIIVISGVFPSAAHRDELFDTHRIAGYLDKPVDVDLLVDILHEHFSDLPASRFGSRLRASSAPEVVDGSLLDLPSIGEFSEVPFARLLGLLFQRRTSSALMLRRGTVKKIVYFQKGIPVFVKSNLLSECLGRVMVAERLITQEECDGSLEHKRQAPHLRQGEILMGMGSISPHDLDFALELQMQTKLLEIFSWLDGTFQINPWPSQPVPHVALSMAPATLIYEGTTRTMSVARVKRDVRVLGDRPLIHSREPTFRDQVEQIEARSGGLVDLVDGTRSFDELLGASPVEPETAVFVLYALWATGLIRPAERSADAVDDVLPDPQTAQTGGLLETFHETRLDAPLAEEPATEVFDLRGFGVTSRGGGGAAGDPPAGAEQQDLEATGAAPQEDEHASVRSAFEASLSADLVVEDPGSRGPNGSPPMSDRLREEIRERLLRETDRLLSERTPGPRPPFVAAAPSDRARREKEQIRLAAELEADIERLEHQGYFERLGLPPGASSEATEDAFATLRREADPDRIHLTAGSHRVRLLAERRAILLRRAYEALSNPVTRARYDAARQREGDRWRAAAWEAEEAFERGRALVEAGEEQRARPLLERALQASPDDPVLVAYAAYARHREAPDDELLRDEALAALEQGAQAAPTCAPLSWFMAEVLLARGDSEGARWALERVVGVDPDHRRAQDALRAIEPAPERKPWLFSRWSLRG